MKNLIIYYSLEGTTKRIAEEMAKEIDCDILGIKPEDEIKNKGFSKYFWGGMQVVMNKMPKLKKIDINIDEYDAIFVGTPIWAATYAPPIKTLLEGDYIKNKKVYYFYTDGGSTPKAGDKAKLVIEKNNNEYLGSKEFVGAENNIEKAVNEAKKWIVELKI